MQKKPTNTPMVRIQERAPDNKWMADARVAPNPVHQATGVIDAASLDPRLVNPPRPGEAPLPKQELDVTPPQDERLTALEEEKTHLEEQLQISSEESEGHIEELQKSLEEAEENFASEQSLNKRLKNRIKDLEEDRKVDAADTAKKLGEMTARIQELEEMEVEEVEVFPTKITFEKVVNMRRKGSMMLLRGTVVIDDDENTLLLRLPYEDLMDALKEVG